MVATLAKPNIMKKTAFTDEVLLNELLKKTSIETRPYQNRIVGKTSSMFMGTFRDATGALEPHARSVLIESPTGSGKTVMAFSAAMHLQALVPNLAIGWVAMRRNLLAQAQRENRDKGFNLERLHMISMFDQNPEELIEHKRRGGKVLMVVDEAQHDAANSMAHLHNLVEPDFILGLSATPFRVDRVKLCFDKVIRDAGIHQLIQDGYLSRFHHYSIKDWSPATVAETYLREPERWGKSIGYFVNLEQCFQCYHLLRAAGVRTDVVTGDSDVEAQLGAFRNNEIDFLVNCMKLTEGFDEPSLQTAFVRDSGKGCTMQMSGRVFRKFKGLKFKQVVQSGNTRWPVLRTAMPDMQYIWQEDSWKSLTVNPSLNTINQNARQAIAQIEVEMPEFIAKKMKKPKKLRF